MGNMSFPLRVRPTQRNQSLQAVGVLILMSSTTQLYEVVEV
jgi:hypothetical protein